MPLAVVALVAAAPPVYISTDDAGKLIYEPDTRGNRIPDFSHCGYGGGGVALPDVPARVVVGPGEGDAGPRIQAALDHVAALPVDAQGFRGAVLLKAGRYEIAGGLRIAADGLVLRGSGDGPEGTLLIASGTDRRTLIRVSGKRERRSASGRTLQVTDSYVPVGARRLTLDRAEGLHMGDSVIVVRPGTAEWVAAIGMDKFPLGYEGALNWRPAAMEIRADRVITSIKGAAITLDAPLTTALDATLGGSSVRPSPSEGRIAHVGVENLRCESAFDQSNPRDEQHAWDAIAFDSAQHAWVRNVTAAHFAGAAVRLLNGCKWVTVQDCASAEPVSEVGGYRRDTFWTSGQMTLFLRCRAEHGRHDFAVGALTPGPNAFVECAAREALGFSGPVESWASGVLYDNVTVDGAGLSLTNRETDGQGAGWTAANSVLWQCSASVITCRNPPGARNWAIGCWGQFVGDGAWQAPNEFVKPVSLYRAQLAERLGAQAVAALEPRAVTTQADGACPIEELWKESTSHPSVPTRPLALRNGWLTVDGSLLTGGRTGTIWWRGSVLPTRTAEFGLGVTRFVPGREGPGFTDDLDVLTDLLRRSGKAALEHHWGLWYDRRRDDHEMIRRPDGDVWPPFYEQPWARSGQGTAWDGLSRYDLEAFNPWYFGRLHRFAELCDRKGLILIHQAYFQHNILEAGAHWADFPWRPTNCLQETGFPEPPPYANGKRIFMADAFYDLSHPLRRSLHRRYIRKCLETLGAHPNVIFLTGEEYTGPVEFVRFWVDTVAEWERETGRDVLIGLSTTKDVQDAILADPLRGPLISMIELKYWWYTADGTLYAPEGGKNLAPRQQLREWRGPKKRSAEQTARQVREYRSRYPDKAVLVSGTPADGWAVLAAGGSMPDLARPDDRGILQSIPHMNVVGHNDSSARQWTLADPGRHYLVYAAAGAPVRLDLTAERGTFTVSRIDPRSGRTTREKEAVEGGRVVEFPAHENEPVVLWMSRRANEEAPHD